jgi:hypothetical protein
MRLYPEQSPKKKMRIHFILMIVSCIKKYRFAEVGKTIQIKLNHFPSIGKMV